MLRVNSGNYKKFHKKKERLEKQSNRLGSGRKKLERDGAGKADEVLLKKDEGETEGIRPTHKKEKKKELKHRQKKKKKKIKEAMQKNLEQGELRKRERKGSEEKGRRKIWRKRANLGTTAGGTELRVAPRSLI